MDFTYVPTWSGMGFTAFVTDVFSRRIVGWRTTNRMPTELPLDALEMALWVRGRAGDSVDGLIHHSDAGSQHTAIRYAERVADAGALASIGTGGDSYDNAMAESVVGLYKNECVKIDGPFKTIDELELATLDWVHWFNDNRLHSSIGYLTPIEIEEHYRETNPQPQPRLGELALHQTRGDSGLGLPHSAPTTASASADSSALMMVCNKLRIRSDDASVRASASTLAGSTI